MTEPNLFADNETELTEEQKIAKRLADKDSHIGNLEQELAELRGELRARTALEDLINKVPPQQAPKVEDPPSEAPKPSEPTDLTAKVQELLRQEKEKENREKAYNTSVSGLRERFGADYKLHLTRIAQKLGVSEKFLNGLASTTPEGFLAMVDSVKEVDKTKPLTPPRSSVDTTRVTGDSPDRGASYYAELRKRDLNEYFSARVQKQMHDDALRLGMDKFNSI